MLDVIIAVVGAAFALIAAIVVRIMIVMWHDEYVNDERRD